MKKVIVIIMAAAAFSSAGCRKTPTADEPSAPAEATAETQPAVAGDGAEQELAAAMEAEAAPPEIDKSASVIVLCYHRFEDKPRDSMAISPADFEKQLEAFKEQGVEVISMDDFLAWRRGEKNIPSKSAIITIDDGYASAYSVAWPILKRFDYPFTMYIYIDYVKGGRLSGGQSLTWEQLAEMRDAGVDIGSHSVSHSNLRSRKKGMSEEQHEAWLREEIAGSKRKLEQELGIRVTTLAYPYGNHNDKVREIAREAGYEAAFSVYGQKIAHDSPADMLGRYAIESNKPEVFTAALRFSGPATGGGAAPAQTLANNAVDTEPKEGATVSDPRPVISADLSGLGAIDADSVEMRISGFGVVPAKFNAETKQVSYKVSPKLREKSYTVILTAKQQGKKVERRWSFNFDPNAAEAGPEAKLN